MTSAAGVLFESGGKVLLCLRAGGDHSGTWAFPGGKIEPGETPEQAARREVQEEIGVDIAEGHLTPICNDGMFQTYKIVTTPFTPRLNGEHTSANWFTRDNLPGPLHPGVREILEAHMTNRVADVNGFIEVKDNPISKVGVFPYSGRMVGAPNPDAVYNVYRPEEELNNPETINSFKLVPFVDDHPSAVLGSEDQDLPNVDGKPAQGVIGEQVYFRDGYLRGNLKYFTDRVKRLLDAGKREVSAGFRCVYEYAPGVWNGQAYDYVQRKIRGNHVALVDQGRMGPEVAVLDHFKMTYDAKELFKMADTPAKNEEAGGGAEMTISEVLKIVESVTPAVQKLSELVAKMGAPAPAAELEVEDESDPAAAATAAATDPAMDKDMAAAALDGVNKVVKSLADLNAKLSQALDSKPAAALDVNDVFTQIAERDALYRDVSPILGAFDHAKMTRDQLARYAADKLGLDAPAGTEVTAVRAYLKAAPRSEAAKVYGLDAADAGKPSAIRQHVAG